MLCVGDGGCGKTSLLYAYVKKKIEWEIYLPTIMDSYSQVIEMDDRRVALEIYDTAGNMNFVTVRSLVLPATNSNHRVRATKQSFKVFVSIFSVHIVLRLRVSNVLRE